jgi:AcrR family transcriptional regulator
MAAPRETILAHAAELFSQGGYEVTSLQDVAAAVGITKAAIYHYFPTKQVLYETIIMDLLGRLEAYVFQASASETTGPARLLAIMQAHARFFEANYAAFVTLLHGVSGLSRQVSEQERVVRDRYEMMLRSTLSEAHDKGELRVRDVQATAIGILSMMNWMSRWYKPDGSRRAEDFAAEFYDLIHDGLRPGS